MTATGPVGVGQPIGDDPGCHRIVDEVGLVEKAGLGEGSRLRLAAFTALDVLPGPVGELVARELRAWAEFGWRIGHHAQIRALVRDIEQRSRRYS